MSRIVLAFGSALILAGALTACGGSGAGLSSTPSPLPIPNPTPTPTPSTTSGSVLKPEVLTIGTNSETVSLTAFEANLVTHFDMDIMSKKVESIISSQPSAPDASIEITFDDNTGVYKITLPYGETGDLVLEGLGGIAGQFATSTSHSIVVNGEKVGNVWMPVPFAQDYPYTYSHYGRWQASDMNIGGGPIEKYGWFVYGYTPSVDAIPKVGTATFTAEILGDSPMDPFWITGSAILAFDFGKGELTGSMHPVHNTNGWYTSYDYDYGIFDFAQTVYAAGSANYSGKFSKDGLLLPDSWFDGSLTGPHADEVIGRFSAPFVRDGEPGTLTGIWIGKKD